MKKIASSEQRNKTILLRIHQYSNLILLLLLIILLIRELYLPFGIIAFFYYFLFGFSVVIQIFMIMNAKYIAYFFTILSCPYFMLPFIKAWHYLSRSILVVALWNNHKAALEYAKKINVENLITDKNKFFYHGLMASIYTDLNDIEQARLYLDLAEEYPEKVIMENQLEKLRKTITNLPVN